MRERFLKRLRLVKGVAVNFRIDRVRLPNRRPAIREYLDHPGAVAVVALDSKGGVLMVRQYRYPVDQLTWEIPAGKLARGENPLVCVRRELEEETGFKAGRIKKLLSTWPTPAFANEVIHIYVADRLNPGTFNPDEDEFLTSRSWPLRRLLQWIKSGRVKDSKTALGLLAYAAWKKSRP